MNSPSGGEHNPGKLCQAEFRRTKRRQGADWASPEVTSRSQAWTAPTTSSGPVTARGVAEPAIQSEITVMRARN